MDASSLTLSALAMFGVLGVTVLLAVLHRRLSGLATPGLWRGSATTPATGFVVALATFPLTSAPLLYLAPIAALGALFAVLATAPLRARFNALPLAIFATLSTALISAPAVAFAFGANTDQLGTGIGLIDFAGSLPGLIAGGAVGLGSILGGRRKAPATAPNPLRWRAVIAPAAMLVIAWLAWTTGVELAFDSYLRPIITNVLLMAAAGLIGGALIERVYRRQNTPAGSVLGVLAGLAASAPASASLTPSIAFISALVIGGLCALLPRRGPVAVLASLVVASSASLLALGALATNMSFIYTGQPEVLFTQAFALILVGAVGFVWGAVASFLLARFFPAQAPAQA
jgi:ammonia channel protein AmtB